MSIQRVPNPNPNANGAAEISLESMSERQSTPLEREILAQILPLLEEKIRQYLQQNLEKKLWELLPHLAEDYLRRELRDVSISSISGESSKS